jgi:iron complex transport system substrate-binding protein
MKSFRMKSSMSRHRRLAPAVALVALALSGPAPAGAASGGYPLRLQAANGTVSIPARPMRIVSLSPSTTEDLYAVGAGRQVAAVDAYSDYPPEAPRTSL